MLPIISLSTDNSYLVSFDGIVNFGSKSLTLCQRSTSTKQESEYHKWNGKDRSVHLLATDSTDSDQTE